MRPALLLLWACSPGVDDSGPEGGESSSSSLVVYSGELEGYLCVPEGDGPFGVAVYNHGGLGDAMGGDPGASCTALMEDGWLGFSPVRRETVSIEGHEDDMVAGIEFARAQARADPDRLAVLGFSRGGFLSVAALARVEGISTGVVMAPAAVNGRLYDLLDEVEAVEASTLVLVAENDLPEFNNEDEDHVATATAVHEALVAADKDSELVILDAWEDNGHDLFQEVRESYWSLIRAHLDEHL